MPTCQQCDRVLLPWHVFVDVRNQDGPQFCSLRCFNRADKTAGIRSTWYFYRKHIKKQGSSSLSRRGCLEHWIVVPPSLPMVTVGLEQDLYDENGNRPAICEWYEDSESWTPSHYGQSDSTESRDADVSFLSDYPPPIWWNSDASSYYYIPPLATALDSPAESRSLAKSIHSDQ